MRELNGNPPLTPIDQEVEPSAEFEHEVEVKILLPDLATANAVLATHGAKLVEPRRLLHDTAFKLKKKARRAEALQVAIGRQAVVGTAENRERLPALLTLIGLNLVRVTDTELVLERPAELQSRVMRLRRDGQRFWWTVKMKRKDAERAGIQTEGFMRRPEQEIELTPQGEAAVGHLLQWLGYEPTEEKEKYRTTYQLGEATIDLNESPFVQAKPWFEVEATTTTAVEQGVAALGYTMADTLAISDNEYYQSLGIPEEQRVRATFDRIRGSHAS